LLDQSFGTPQFASAWAEVIAYLKVPGLHPGKAPRLEQVLEVVNLEWVDPSIGDDVIEMIGANIFRPLWRLDPRALALEMKMHFDDPQIVQLRLAYRILSRSVQVFKDFDLVFARRLADNVRSVDGSERECVVAAIIGFVARDRRRRSAPIIAHLLSLLDELTESRLAPPAAASVIHMLSRLGGEDHDVITRVIPLLGNGGLMYIQDELIHWLRRAASSDLAIRGKVWGHIVHHFPTARRSAALALLVTMLNLGTAPSKFIPVLFRVIARLLQRDDEEIVAGAIALMRLAWFVSEVQTAPLRSLTPLLDVLAVACYAKAEGDTPRRSACHQTLELITKGRPAIWRAYTASFVDRAGAARSKWARIARSADREVPPGAPKSDPLMRELAADPRALRLLTSVPDGDESESTQ
jgi:hypothetical protein